MAREPLLADSIVAATTTLFLTATLAAIAPLGPPPPAAPTPACVSPHHSLLPSSRNITRSRMSPTSPTSPAARVVSSTTPDTLANWFVPDLRVPLAAFMHTVDVRPPALPPRTTCSATNARKAGATGGPPPPHKISRLAATATAGATKAPLRLPTLVANNTRRALALAVTVPNLRSYDMWMTKNPAAVVMIGSKSERPLLRSVRAARDPRARPRP